MAFDESPKLDIEKGNLFGKLSQYRFLIKRNNVPNPEMSLTLTLNPKEYEVSEPFAVNIQPTIGDSFVIENQGIVVRDITISGTTGYYPKLDRKGIDKTSPEKVSGYEEFMLLRHLFRHYAHLKRTDKNFNEYKMILCDYKNEEFLVVEPLTFRMRRSSRSPLSYEYFISLRAIRKAEQVQRDLVAIKKDTILDKIQNFRQSISDIVSDIRSATDEVAYYADKYTKFATSMLNTAINAVESVIGAIETFAEIKDTIISIPKQTINSAAQLVDDARDAIEAALSGIIDTESISFLRNLNRISSNLRRISSFDEAFSSNFQDRARKLSAYYAKEGIRADFTTIAYTRVSFNEDIYDVSARILGSSDRWKELVILNNLKYPYISETRSLGVLAYGDVILYPANRSVSAGGINNIVNVNMAKIGMQDFNPEEDQFGVDLFLSEDGDIVLNANNDFSLIRGIENLKQALRIKINVELGELKLHKWFGLPFSVGTKTKSEKLLDAKMSLRECLLSDPRIDSVEKIDVVLDGDTANVSAYVIPKGIDYRVTIQSSSVRV